MSFKGILRRESFWFFNIFFSHRVFDKMHYSNFVFTREPYSENVTKTV